MLPNHGPTHGSGNMAGNAPPQATPTTLTDLIVFGVSEGLHDCVCPALKACLIMFAKTKRGTGYSSGIQDSWCAAVYATKELARNAVLKQGVRWHTGTPVIIREMKYKEDLQATALTAVTSSKAPAKAKAPWHRDNVEQPAPSFRRSFQIVDFGVPLPPPPPPPPPPWHQVPAFGGSSHTAPSAPTTPPLQPWTAMAATHTPPSAPASSSPRTAMATKLVDMLGEEKAKHDAVQRAVLTSALSDYLGHLASGSSSTTAPSSSNAPVKIETSSSNHPVKIEPSSSIVPATIRPSSSSSCRATVKKEDDTEGSEGSGDNVDVCYEIAQPVPTVPRREPFKPTRVLVPKRRRQAKEARTDPYL